MVLCQRGSRTSHQRVISSSINGPTMQMSDRERTGPLPESTFADPTPISLSLQAFIRPATNTTIAIQYCPYRAVLLGFWHLILNNWQASAQRRQRARAPGAIAAEVIEKGSRTNWLVSLAGTMNKRGMDPADIEKALLAENLAKCSPHLPIEKVREIAYDIPARYLNPPESDPKPESIGIKLHSLGDLALRMRSS